MIDHQASMQIPIPELADTDKLAAKIAKDLVAGLVIYLEGDLGAGKTTFVRSLLQSLGYSQKVKSPTFTIVEEYKLNDFKIFHFDLYRISCPEELELIGIRDYLEQDGICIFEWPEKGAGVIPRANIELKLEFSDKGRLAHIKGWHAN